MKKRTERLDDEREIDLGMELNGKPGFVKAGSLKVSEADKEEASANIGIEKLNGEVDRACQAIFDEAENLCQQVLARVAPQSFWEAYEKVEECEESRGLVEGWLRENEFCVVVEGLKILVKMKGKVLVEVEAQVPGDIKSLVEVKVKEEVQNV